MSSPDPSESSQPTGSSREQIAFRFCRDCSNMLYPKEDKLSNTLMFACRTCQFSEPAVSSCVFRNHLYNTVGETAGVTQDVGADPTVSRDAYPGECNIKEGGCEVVYRCGYKVEEQAVGITFCTLCGDEIFCTFCGQEPAVAEGVWKEAEVEVVDVGIMDEGDDYWSEDGDDLSSIEEQSRCDSGRLHSSHQNTSTALAC